MTDSVSRDEEARYWDSHEAVGRGKSFRRVPATPVENLAYRLSLRLTPSAMHRLAAEAERRGVRLTGLARQFILEGLEQQAPGSLEAPVEALAREVEGLKSRST